jgi:hypothetical protein
MRVDELRSLLKADDFKPFHVLLASGDRLYVPHIDYMTITLSGRTVLVHKKEGGFHMTDPRHIVGVEVEESTAA